MTANTKLPKVKSQSAEAAEETASTNGPQVDYIHINIPITYKTYIKWDDAEKARITAEYLQIKARSIFIHLAKLGIDDDEDLGPITETLGEIGTGLMEALEIAQRDYIALSQEKWAKTA